MDETIFNKLAPPILSVVGGIGLASGFALGLGPLLSIATGIGLAIAAGIGVAVHSAGGVTPFMTWFGQQPWFGAEPILKDGSTASLTADTITHSGEIAQYALPAAGLATPAIAMEGGNGVRHFFKRHDYTNRLLGEAEGIVKKYKASDAAGKFPTPEEHEVLQKAVKHSRGWTGIGIHREYGWRFYDPRTWSNNKTQVINDSKALLARSDQAIVDGKLPPEGYKHLTKARPSGTSQPAKPTAASEPPVVKDPIGAAEPVEAKIVDAEKPAAIKPAEVASDTYRVQPDANGNVVMEDLDANGKPTTQPIIEAELVESAPNKTLAGDVVARPGTVHSSVTDATAAHTVTNSKTPMGSTPSNPTPMSISGTRESSMVASGRGADVNIPTGTQVMPDMDGAFGAQNSRAAPQSKLANAQPPLVEPPIVKNPIGTGVPYRGSGFAAGTQLVSGPMRMAYGQTAAERWTGGFEFADGAGEGLAFFRPMWRGAKFVPLLTVPAAGVGAVVDGKHGVQQIASGNIDGAGNIALSGLETTVALDAVGRSANVLSNAQRLQPLVNNPVGQKLLQGAGVVGRFGSRANPVTGAALGTYNIGRFSYESGMLGHEAMEAFDPKQDQQIHGSGVSQQYVDKVGQMLANKALEEAPLERPDFSEYKKLSLGLSYAKKYLKLPNGKKLSDADLKAASPQELEAYLKSTYVGLKNYREQQLDQVSDSVLNLRNLALSINPAYFSIAAASKLMGADITNDRALAKNRAGRMLLNSEDELMGRGAGSERLTATDKVDNIETQMRIIKSALLELKGDENGMLEHGESYLKRLAQFEKTSALRKEIAEGADMNPEAIQQMREQIKKLADYKRSVLYDTKISAAFMDKVKTNLQIKQLQKESDRYAQALKASYHADKHGKGGHRIEDELVTYQALKAELDLLKAEYPIIRQTAHEVHPNIFPDPNKESAVLAKKEAAKETTVITGGAEATASDFESSPATSAPLPVADKGKGTGQGNQSGAAPQA